jgi:hypothetical protein
MTYLLSIAPIAYLILFFMYVVWDYITLERAAAWRTDIRGKVWRNIGTENQYKNRNVMDELRRVNLMAHHRHIRRFQNPADLYNFDPVTLEKKDQR